MKEKPCFHFSVIYCDCVADLLLHTLVVHHDGFYLDT